MNTPRRLLALFALSSLLLGGCSSLLVQRAPFTIYSPRYTAPAAQPGPQVRWQLAIETPLASDTLDIAAHPPERIGSRLQQWKLDGALRAYHAGLHPALFNHPRHLQAIFDSSGCPA